jgi:hypothetical protein
MATLVNQILVAIVDAFTNADGAENREFRSQPEEPTYIDNVNNTIKPPSMDAPAVFCCDIDESGEEIEVDIFVCGDSCNELCVPIVDEIHRVVANDFEVNTLLTEIREMSKSWSHQVSEPAADVALPAHDIHYLPLAKGLALYMQ